MINIGTKRVKHDKRSEETSERREIETGPSEDGGRGKKAAGENGNGNRKGRGPISIDS